MLSFLQPLYIWLYNRKKTSFLGLSSIAPKGLPFITAT